MLQQVRHERIIQILSEKSFLSLEEATNLFQVSPATIRRDFEELALHKSVIRIRGGVKLNQELDLGMTPFPLREIRYSAQKTALAQAAVALLKPGDVIFVDGGTTTYHLGQFMPDFGLRVITNSLRLANILEEKRGPKLGLEIYVTGGCLYPQSGLLLGPSASVNLSRYHANWAFLSAGGINRMGIFNSNEMVVESEQAMIAHADKVVIMADHSKIEKHSMCHICNLEKINFLITDDWPENKDFINELRQMNIEIILVNVGHY